MPRRSGYLGLGSNLGDAAAHLRAAVVLMPENEIEVEAISSTYLTEPVGEVLDQPDFLNAAVRISTELEPEELLEACKEIEAERGRSARDEAAREAARREVLFAVDAGSTLAYALIVFLRVPETRPATPAHPARGAGPGLGAGRRAFQVGADRLPEERHVRDPAGVGKHARSMCRRRPGSQELR